jgi:hypothetical protein
VQGTRIRQLQKRLLANILVACLSLSAAATAAVVCLSSRIP